MNERDSNHDGAVAFDVIPLGHRRRRVDPGLILIGLAAILVVAAITRPWELGAQPVALDPVAAPGSSRAPAPSSALSPAFTSSPSNAPNQPDLARVTHDLAVRSGVWAVGVGSTSAGPAQSALGQSLASTVGDLNWSEWQAVRPTAGPSPTPGILDLCTGLSRLPAGAQVIAITAPSGRSADVQVQGWGLLGWRDDPALVEPLAGLGQVSAFRSADISYLERADGQPWPAGRYEFRIAGGARSGSTTLTVCLGEP